MDDKGDFMKKKSYAKINLTLDVIEKRQDGYHNIDGIIQMIDLYDEVEVKISDEFKITSNSKDIPLDENNLVYKAYLAMKEKYKFKEKFSIHIEKNIPVSAGIAGGSTNSAVVRTIWSVASSTTLIPTSSALALPLKNASAFLMKKPM